MVNSSDCKCEALNRQKSCTIKMKYISNTCQRQVGDVIAVLLSTTLLLLQIYMECIICTVQYMIHPLLLDMNKMILLHHFFRIIAVWNLLNSF